MLGADDRAPGKVVDAASPLFGERALNGAVRVLRDLHKDSYAGVLLTERRFGESESQLWSADTKMRLSPNLYFRGQVAWQQGCELRSKRRTFLKARDRHISASYRTGGGTRPITSVIRR